MKKKGCWRALPAKERKTKHYIVGRTLDIYEDRYINARIEVIKRRDGSGLEEHFNSEDEAKEVAKQLNDATSVLKKWRVDV